MMTKKLSRRLAVAALSATLLPLYAATAAEAAITLPPVTSTLVSANPADNTPHALNGDVTSFAEIGDTVYVGGSFTAIRTAASSTRIARSYLFAYNRTTGAIVTGFAPVLDANVQALAVSPDGKLLVGGAFKTVNKVARKGLVELDPATGATVSSFTGVADGGVVRRLVVQGNNLYLAGAFHYLNGRRHSLLGRMDATTGVIDQTFQVDASVARTKTELVWGMAVSPDGRTLVAVGNFTQVNGLARNQAVMVDLSGTPAVADWSTQHYVAPCASAAFPFYARDVDFSDDGSYFVIVADGGYQAGAYCDSISRWETATLGSNLDATWVDETGRDSVTSVEVADNVIYAAGHFRWLNNANGLDSAGPGAVDRYGFGAIDPINGMPMSWNPTREGAPAGTTKWGPIVNELWRGTTGLYTGFNSDGLGHEYHGRMGFFPLAGGRTVAAVNAPSATSGYLYLGGTSGKLTKVAFDGSALGTPAVTTQANLSGTGAAFIAGNKLYWAKSGGTRGTLQVSTFTAGTASASWLSSGFNAWYNAIGMTGAFYLDGRIFYTLNGDNHLYWRYFEPDGAVVGSLSTQVPSTGVAWGSVRGMTYSGGKIIFGSTTGELRSVPMDLDGVDGSAATVLATSSWTSPTLFFATS